MSLIQVLPYLSCAIQYSSIKIIDSILLMSLSSFHGINLRVSRVLELYECCSKDCSSPHGCIADDPIMYFEIQSQDDHLNKNLRCIENCCRDRVMHFTCWKHNCLTSGIKIMT